MQKEVHKIVGPARPLVVVAQRNAAALCRLRQRGGYQRGPCRSGDGDPHRRSSKRDVVALDIAGGQITSISAIVNPDKLRHLGPVADLRALLRKRS